MPPALCVKQEPSCGGGNPESQQGEGSSEERLLQFANIATGLQSPLLASCPNWTHSVQEESKVHTPCPLSSIPSTACQYEPPFSTAPAPVWQCFIKGTKILLDHDPLHWLTAEDIASAFLQGQTHRLPSDLCRPVDLQLKDQPISQGSDRVDLRFESLGSLRSCLTASCCTKHPFFVRNKGWASCDCRETRALYNLPCLALETGDVCLPLAHSQPPRAVRDPEQSEVHSLEHSSIVALSEMAQVRHGGLASGGQHSSTFNPSAPKAKRPMNAFLLWSQIKRPEFITKFPHTNNRVISNMLSKEWDKLSAADKKTLSQTAQMKARLHQSLYPNCWKRKK